MKWPVMAFQRSDTAPTTAAPPPIAIFRRVQSTSPSFGCCTSPPYSVLTPMKTVGLACANTPTKPSMSRGLATSQFSAPTDR